MFQLTPIEMLLFTVIVAVSLYFSYRGFKKVIQVIRRGQGEPPLHEMPRRLFLAAVHWIALAPTWRARPGSSFMHALIAWGFIFYFLVNGLDVLKGYTGWDVPGAAGDIYRLLADLLSAAVLLGMVYFLLRRFLFKSKALTFNDNVKLMDKVKAGGMRRNSLIVGVFILCHVGFRLLGQSFGVAAHELDPWQPVASGIANLWSGMSEPALVVAEHISWWIALVLILAFLPYFPYTKHFHLIMSGFNFLLKPKRTSLGELEPIDLEDEFIEQFGAARLEDLHWKQIIDAYSCIMCNRCQDVCPAYTTGKELSPSALEINKRYYINANLNGLANGDQSIPLLDYAISEFGGLGLHGLRRLRPDLPGRQRADVRHPVHAPQPGADGEQLPARIAGRLPWHGTLRQPVEPGAQGSHGLGQGAGDRDGGGQPRLRPAVVGRLRALL